MDKFAAIIRDWIGLGTIVTVLVLGAGKWTAYVEFRTKTEDRLDSIEKSLQKIDLAQTKFSLIEQASLPVEELKSTLSEVGSTVEKARTHNLKVSPPVVESLAAKLKAIDTSTPGYWSAAGAVISYRSSLMPGSPTISVHFPPCVPLTPEMKAQVESPDGKIIGVPPFTPSAMTSVNCYVELDRKTIVHGSCTHCVVKYGGGPVSLTDVQFIDSLFLVDFSPTQLPTPSGQRFGEILLASESNNVKIQSL